MSERRCGNCRHFFPEAQGNGHCRLNPPTLTVFLVGIKEGVPQLHMDSRFPVTRQDVWCGQWVLKLEIASTLPDMIGIPRGTG